MFLLSQYSFWLQTKDKTLPWFPKAQRDIVKHLVFPNQKSKNRRHLDRTIMQNEKKGHSFKHLIVCFLSLLSGSFRFFAVNMTAGLIFLSSDGPCRVCS